MISVKSFFIFLIRFRKGYTSVDSVKIFLYTILFILLYPVNRMSFFLIKKLILHPKVLFTNFKVKNSDGVYICRDNVDFDIISESFEIGIRDYFKGLQKGVFVDVGSNVGKYTVMVGNQLGNNGKIISIEPHPDNFRILNEAVGLNGCKNVIAVNMACWNKKERLKLFSHEDQPLLASAVKQSKSYVDVKADTLDSILDRLEIKDIALIKLDVEGAESKVLEGMKRTLKIIKPRIIFEAWNDDYVNACKKILEDHNYRVRHLDKMYWMGVHGRD